MGDKILCRFHVLNLNQRALLRRLIPAKEYTKSDIELSEKLETVPKVPIVQGFTKMPKMMRRNIDIRGPELVHNTLIHNQYGIMAVTGGNLLHCHFELLKNFINRKIKEQKIFAIWRVDPPWKSISKKSQGLRMGGGKAPVHHYVTPVKSGRIIVEVGGKVEFGEVKQWLNNIAGVLPFKAIAISAELLAEREQVLQTGQAHPDKQNINPYTFEFCVKNRMQGCYNWLSPYDYEWLGRYK